MNDQKAGLKIFPKLLLTMLVVAAIPLAGLWYNIIQAQEDWEKNLTVQLTQAASSVVHQVDDWVDKNQRALHNSALLPDVVSMDAARQQPILRSLLQTYEWSYLTHTVDRKGQNVSRSDNKAPKYYGDREYFKQVMKGQPYGYQVLIGRTSGKPALVISAPIYAPGTINTRGKSSLATLLTKKIRGAVSLAAHLTDISAAVTDTKIGKTGFAILLDQKGKAVAHGKPEMLAQALQDLSDHPAFHSQAIGKRTVYEKEGKHVVAYSQKTKNGWTLIIQQDFAEAFGPLLKAKRISWILLAVSLVLVFFATLLFAQRLVQPIRQLTDIADGYSRGQLQARIPGTNRGDEIGALARAVQRMGVSIKMAFKELNDTAKSA
jgi:methyl-accepting chemotaxis protein